MSDFEVIATDCSDPRDRLDQLPRLLQLYELGMHSWPEHEQVTIRVESPHQGRMFTQIELGVDSVARAFRCSTRTIQRVFAETDDAESLNRHIWRRRLTDFRRSGTVCPDRGTPPVSTAIA